jgi:DNA polymerase-1
MGVTTSEPAAPPDIRGKTVWVIDTLSRAYQLFHALPEMSAPDGTPVSVIFGFTRDLLDIVENRRPDYLLCAMDAAGPTFRHERFADYKANRAEMPADLVPQIPLVGRLLDVLGIPCLELAGYEADDILATVATRVVAAGGACTIATSDKDARQLLGDRVRLFNLRNNAALGPDELAAEWGIRPDQVVDFLALVGDAVDNVPGVPGIGPKTATELLQAHGTLDGVLANVASIRQAKRRENLMLHGDTARAGRELIRLDTAVPLEIPWGAAARHAPDPERLAAFLREMGFRSLLARVPAARPTGMLFDLGAEDAADAAGSPAADGARPRIVAEPRQVEPWLEPVDAAAAAAAVARLREAAAPLVVCAVPEASGPAAGAVAFVPPAALVAAAGPVRAWIPRAVLEACRPLQELLADPRVPKHGHDLKRTEVAVAAAGHRLAGQACDTLLAAYLLEAGERNLGLVETCRRQGVPVDAWLPEGIAVAAVDQPSDLPAAAVHVAAVEALAAVLPPRLDAVGLASLYADVEMPLATVLAAMECRGVRLDPGVLATLSTDYAVRLVAVEREIHALAGHEFAINSPLQVRRVLFDELGLPVVKRTKTGPSTDAEVLEELAARHPLPRMLLEHRKYAKLKSTYVDALPALIHPATGRVHTSFNQTVTATGRLSSSDPNLQNIPVRTAEGQQIRAAFRPRETGWKFIAADYSQIELRMLAHLAGDAAMREAFAAGEDIHTRTAALVHGVEAGAVTPAMRRAAKAVNFGILYGQSAFGLGKALGIPQADAVAFITAYFAAFSGAATFIDEVLDRCRRDGHVSTVLGRRRTIGGVRERRARRNATGVFALSLPERTAVNTVVQGSAADLIKLAMLRVHRRLEAEERAAAIVLQIHDELLLEAPAVEVEAVSRLAAEEMRAALRLEVPLEVSVHTGATWAECEK